MEQEEQKKAREEKKEDQKKAREKKKEEQKRARDKKKEGQKRAQEDKKDTCKKGAKATEVNETDRGQDDGKGRRVGNSERFVF